MLVRGALEPGCRICLTSSSPPNTRTRLYTLPSLSPRLYPCPCSHPDLPCLSPFPQLAWMPCTRARATLPASPMCCVCWATSRSSACCACVLCWATRQRGSRCAAAVHARVLATLPAGSCSRYPRLLPHCPVSPHPPHTLISLHPHTPHTHTHPFTHLLTRTHTHSPPVHPLPFHRSWPRSTRTSGAPCLPPRLRWPASRSTTTRATPTWHWGAT